MFRESFPHSEYPYSLLTISNLQFVIVKLNSKQFLLNNYIEALRLFSAPTRTQSNFGNARSWGIYA